MPPPVKLKSRNGSAILLMVIASTILISVIGVSITKVNQVAFSGLNASNSALQAQQYASAKAELIKSIDYNLLSAQARSDISGSDGYQDEVILGAETVYPGYDKINQRILTVNIYRSGESVPCSSMIVNRFSQELESDVPQGTIIPWYGSLKDLPKGFALCNGANGTPDLRNRFLVGAGSSYTLGATGGVNEVLLEAEQTASHYHRFGYHNNNNTGYFLTSEGTRVQAPLASWMRAGFWNGSGGGSYTGQPIGAGQNMVTSLAVGVDAHKPHENRPPFFSVYYIIKL